MKRMLLPGMCNSRSRRSPQLHGFQYAVSCLMFGAVLALGNGTEAQEQVRDGDWLHSTDLDTGKRTLTMQMRVRPAAEPRPALSVRFIPDEYGRMDGNSSVFYLKATGFFEQTIARQKVAEFYQRASNEANETGEDIDRFPPHNWLEMAPGDLPVEEVKEFLSLTAFQMRFLKEAASRRGFSMDRAIENVDNPIAYLLPEIQAFRQTARMQSLRTRVAIAEGRIDDAIELIGQQFAMANHLCQDDFLVSGLVGIAIQNIAWVDALYLSQHKDAPNLYWAYASLPKNLVEMPKAYTFERNILYEQIKVLKEVNEQPRSVGYWNDFIDRLLPQIKGLGVEGLQIVSDQYSAAMQRAQLVGFIGAAYPSARRFLVEDEGMDAARVDAYPVTQTVMLALCKFHNQMRDELWKWRLLPYHEAVASEGFSEAERQMQQLSDKVGLISGPALIFLPAMQSVVAAESRAKMMLAMTQTIESLRAYAADNDGRLPKSLENLPLPAPTNPFTGRKIEYELNGNRAILIGTAKHIRYRLVVEARS